MVSIKSIALSAYALTAAQLVSAAPATTLPANAEEVKEVELGVYVNDITKNLMEYYAFRAEHPEQAYPGIIETAVFEDMMGQPQSEWINQLTTIDYNEVQSMFTGVPWYSDRLAPALSSSLKALNIATTVATV
ncbi:SRP1/TIP1 family protein KNAG_0E01130 [Huiozyma naganishii CBS 8797]|uniref:Seripauperin n=1 Tax=Huiozyma naganishii (strain ATCC MYA-139 / BCRC 22969 / CBS 8797 / KCTC 17520 / NBRC 10181 / NCYC 3082 / Yp74L-3) TaxID=1071383 RepID=J7R698_HUIN7|nr:hypothetical protein KNAG_0E01130 [Kazachstania naganishii CBS 8797]CCK70380.1 hypothetical protein KNAG_0E01130 [Kazachstania naganishii CBS 8797]